MDVFLRTDRMQLRAFTADDLDLLVELDNDPRVMRYINDGRPVDRADVGDALDSWLRYDHSTGYGFWAAIETVTGAFIGWFHYRPPPSAGPFEPELGYRLHEQAWGRGFATEGSRALIDNGFSEFGVERVTAETMAVNIASRRVMEKAGMQLVRRFRADWPVRIPGDEEGDVEYTISQAQWKSARS